MGNQVRKLGFGALAAGLIAFGAEEARAEPSAVIFFGGGISEDAISAFGGAVWAPWGFSNDGVFFRAIVTTGSFDFATSLAAIGIADTNFYGANFSVGYRMKFDEIVVAPFVGFDVYDRRINPLSADTGQIDDSFGVIVGARIDNSGIVRGDTGDITWAIDGSWASTNNRYYVEGEVGYDVGGVSLGPEAAALGDDEYNAFRLGGFGAVNVSPTVQVKVGAGYQFGSDDNATGRGSDSAYGELAIGIAF